MAADSIGWLYLGRILTGVGNGMSSLVTSVYVSEVASSNARGTIYENEMGYSILFSLLMRGMIYVQLLKDACDSVSEHKHRRI